MHTALYVSDITSYHYSKARKQEGESTAFNAKSCCAICKQTTIQVTDHGVLFSCETSSRILMRSVHNCKTPVQRQWLPNPFLLKPNTTHYTEARSSYPTVTSQATSCSFSQVSASTKRHWCLLYIPSAALAKNQEEPPFMRGSWLPLSCTSMRLQLIPGTSKGQQLLAIGITLNITVSVPAGYEASSTLCAGFETH